jgi:L-fuconolactonase
MVTEADFTRWSEDQLQPYFDVVLDAFKPRRLMFGSDWPVCLLGIHYKQWADMVRKFISTLSIDEQAAIMGENACRAYKINEIE